MKKNSYRPYFFLIFFLFALLSVSQETTDKMRSTAIASLSPCWKGLNSLKEKSLFFLSIPQTTPSFPQGVDVEQILQENQLLRSQMESMREWLLFSERVQEQLEWLKVINERAAEGSEWRDFFTRRGQELVRSLEWQIGSLPAKVIFREPTSWSSTLWINLGEKDNERLKRCVIGPSSPVLVGRSVVGVVEYVGKTQSRVRLITDARLSPSVRVVRGEEQNRYLLEHLEAVIRSLDLRSDLFEDPLRKEESIQRLSQLKTTLLKQSKDLYLAKGILQGTSHPLWRSRVQVLKGLGFNCDFSDRESSARDLRSGIAYDSASKEPIALLSQGDLLVTTGLDGIFPPGLHVAIISSIGLLKEGATSYDIQAIATAGDLNELKDLFVLPPSNANFSNGYGNN